MKKLFLALALGLGLFGLIKYTKYMPGNNLANANATTSSGAQGATTITDSTPTPAASATPVATTTPVANASSASRNQSGTFDGSAVDIGYGIVQVQITVASGKITAIKMLQAPSDGRSQMIANYSTPILIQETISAQSASINGVSGATYTSEGFVQSLKAAMTSANL